ncbi:unnamed protein product, partial [Larinioides sclopetarius]
MHDKMLPNVNMMKAPARSTSLRGSEIGALLPV